MTTLGKLSPREQRQQVRVRDYYTGETIYLSDRLHDGWEQEIEIYLGFHAEIEEVETEDGFTLITADDEPAGYIGEHPNLPVCAQREAAE